MQEVKQTEKETKLLELDSWKLKLFSLPPKERYALMEDRINEGYCPNCNIKLKRKKHYKYQCGKCKFTISYH